MHIESQKVYVSIFHSGGDSNRRFTVPKAGTLTTAPHRLSVRILLIPIYRSPFKQKPLCYESRVARWYIFRPKINSLGIFLWAL
jgi:hypothetical protein